MQSATLRALLLALLAVGMAAPALAPDPDAAPLPSPSPSPPPPAPAPTPAAAPEPDPVRVGGGDHRHLSPAWSTLFSADNGPHRRRHHHRGHTGHGHRDGAKPCATCDAQRQLLEQDYDEMTALRIEFVKQQILKKLGLKEPPVVPKRSPTAASMPKPLALAGLALPLPSRQREDTMDEFYGRTDQVILFPTEPAEPAPGSASFLFKLPADIQAVDVTRADLWLYRQGVQAENATLAVSEVANWDLDASFQRRNHVASEPVAEGDGWVKVDFARTIKYWFEFNELAKMVEASGVTVATDGPYKPFLVVATNPVSKVRRPKRNARCVPGMSECCRDNLYVSFKEIGWDDWILQPLGYEAYFCRGSCTTAASLTITGSHHNAIVRRLMQTGKKVDLVPCCTPTKYSEISLLYINNNQTYIQKTLPNMVVEACGCN